MYPYHNRILQRINSGELVGVAKSGKVGYAFVLVFDTEPYTRPVKYAAVERYLRVGKVMEFLKREDDFVN